MICDARAVKYIVLFFLIGSLKYIARACVRVCEELLRNTNTLGSSKCMRFPLAQFLKPSLH